MALAKLPGGFLVHLEELRGLCHLAAEGRTPSTALQLILGYLAWRPSGACMAAGFDLTCAITSRGQLVCFGENDHGQCDVPEDLGPVLAVAAGIFHTCAITSQGQLVCFGNHGQCDVPEDLGPVLAVAAGGAHTCAITSQGQLACFGWNGQGQCDVPEDLGPVRTQGQG